MFAALNAFLTRAVSGYFLNKSLRFRSSASAYLNRTFGTPTNNKKWTWSGWVKRGALGASETIFSSFQNGSNYFDFRFNTSDQLFVQNRVGAVNLLAANTTAVYRDPSAWYHIMFVFDSDNATAANRNLLYVNGVSVAWSANSGSSNASNFNASGYEHDISGSQTAGLWALFDGEQAEINFVDGLALDPTMFGAYSAYNQWLPVSYSGYMGANGFYLPFNVGTDTSSVSVSYLAVAGGGGGGTGQSASTVGNGGGGGAGGVLTGTTSLVINGVYPVVVGAGGNAGTPGVNSGSGANSTAFGVTATGGGAGGSYNGNNGQTGGSGGGAGYGGTAGSGTSGQGYAGGAGNTAGSPYQAGGGGGAGAVGTNGPGGIGVQSSITGSSVYYAGGGAGGNGSNVTGSSGGSGGGGTGGYGTTAGTAGTTNLGGGGGGGGNQGTGGTTSSNGAAGGSGVIIISYSGTQKFYGGNVTSVGGNTIHTFTTSGSLTSVFGDQSGNNNNWTPNNINVSTVGPTYDLLTDVPTLTSATAANYCVINPLVKNACTITNGNLTASGPVTYTKSVVCSIGMTTGLFYWEAVFTRTSSTDGSVNIGIVPPIWDNGSSAGSPSVFPGKSADSYGVEGNSGQKVNNSVFTAYGSVFASGDIIMIAYDATNGKFYAGKNGTWFNSGNPATGTNAAFTGLTGTYLPAYGVSYDSGSSIVNVNFGQRPFTYTAPSGFLPLNTFNI